MSFWPKSRKARRRLTILLAVAPVLALAVGLALYGLRDSISFFYTPSQAIEAKVPAGRAVQLGGLVLAGSVVKKPDGEVDFTIADKRAASKVVYRGDLPDLFREGQGVVAQGSYNAAGVFEAKQVLAKHDEKYMPREVAKALKEQGEWYGEGGKSRPASFDTAASQPAQDDELRDSHGEQPHSGVSNHARPHS
jgi:cytochrome c-type biogenesis protein CcmE